jgi:hypothetical protein
VEGFKVLYEHEFLRIAEAVRYCQVSITSSPRALMTLCIVAIAVTSPSMLFYFFEFTLLWNLFVLIPHFP